ELTTFIWRGLDDGNYKLVETTTPSGYNTIAPITFAIHAEHDLESADPKLTNLHTSNSFVADRAAGTLKGDIVNQAGAVLPSTGGTGTTFLYVIGAALILGAGIALVVRKRARDN
ncbi:MAG: LPXTG cell wall anchor domain-containing protein, partial [Eggerthellaceae bacterium]|nr:LPXTG cell wall anchor domain-containing protein [Eggerthellaceae bacterium]